MEVLKKTQTVVVVSEHQGSSVGWVRLHDEEAIAGLVRKLPHYGKYGALLFEGADPRNIIKQTWPVVSRALSWSSSETPGSWRFPDRAPLYVKQESSKREVK